MPLGAVKKELMKYSVRERRALRGNINESEDVQTLKNHLYLGAKMVF